MSLSCNCYVISVFQQCNVELVMCSSMKCNLFINLKLLWHSKHINKLKYINVVYLLNFFSAEFKVNVIKYFGFFFRSCRIHGFVVILVHRLAMALCRIHGLWKTRKKCDRLAIVFYRQYTPIMLNWYIRIDHHSKCICLLQKDYKIHVFKDQLALQKSFRKGLQNT